LAKHLHSFLLIFFLFSYLVKRIFLDIKIFQKKPWILLFLFVGLPCFFFFFLYLVSHSTSRRP
jgi:drug/metabolite transporter (DMT)-like permease